MVQAYLDNKKELDGDELIDSQKDVHETYEMEGHSRPLELLAQGLVELHDSHRPEIG